jgi:hypothetical protein
MSIVTSISVTLAGEGSNSARAEVCGSSHKVGDIIGIRVFLPTGYRVTEVFCTMQNVGGGKVVYSGKQNVWINDVIRLGIGTEGKLSNIPVGAVNGFWVGHSFGAVQVVGQTVSVVGSASSGLCLDTSDATKVFRKVGLWKANYYAEAFVYAFHSPLESALRPYGEPPYPVDIQFWCTK